MYKNTHYTNIVISMLPASYNVYNVFIMFFSFIHIHLVNTLPSIDITSFHCYTCIMFFMYKNEHYKKNIIKKHYGMYKKH